MKQSNGYDTSWDRLQKTVEAIDKRTEEHTKGFSILDNHLQTIATNTGVMASHFDGVRKDNRGLTQFLGRALLLVLTAVAVFLITDNLKDANFDVKVPWLGIELTHPHPPTNPRGD